MLLTDEEELANRARSLRAHGWARERSDHASIERKYPEIDSRFLFVEAGFNLRPTEFQGALGLVQLERLPSELAARRRNANYLNRELQQHDELEFLECPANIQPSWFGYPIILKRGCPHRRFELARFLEANGVETRPIVAGNIVKHPLMRKVPHEIAGSLNHAQHIMDDGLYVGNHGGITAEMRSHFIDCMNDFFVD